METSADRNGNQHVLSNWHLNTKSKDSIHLSHLKAMCIHGRKITERTVSYNNYKNIYSAVKDKPIIDEHIADIKHQSQTKTQAMSWHQSCMGKLKSEHSVSHLPYHKRQWDCTVIKQTHAMNVRAFYAYHWVYSHMQNSTREMMSHTRCNSSVHCSYQLCSVQPYYSIIGYNR